MERSAVAPAVSALLQLGFKVRLDERAFQVQRYLAGSDTARAQELISFIENPDVHGIMALRGGYGCSRLIPDLEESNIRGNCKVIMGFSDLTTLHLYLWKRFRWVTFHGPMATSPLWGHLKSDYADHLLSLWMDPGYRPTLTFPQVEVWTEGVATGRMVGGCLSLVAASLGTRFEIQTRGCILFLEDLGEAPYRIDRLMMQLRLAGKLDSVAGIVLGDFDGCAPADGDYTVEDVLREYLGHLQVPVIAKFPAGHGECNWPFPLGVRARLDASGKSLTFIDAAVENAP
jgi:muramoyltetrapeptide carboxypeptidase